MATYSVYAFFNSCGEVHPMGISIALADGPVKKEVSEMPIQEKTYQQALRH